jgi:hypothetical protein
VASFPSWATNGVVRSQWIFRASSDGAHLGYLTPATGMLHLRDRSGSEKALAGVGSNDWRFSPDGARVAAIVGADRLRSIVVLDLASGMANPLGRAMLADRVEWTRGGVVVRERDPRAWSDGQQLTYYPLTGASRTLLRRRRIHYATAANAARVIVFEVAPDGGADVLALSIEDPRATVWLGRVDEVRDAEVSPDGRRAAVVTANGVYLIERRPSLVSRENDVSTLWFSSDGARLLFASPRAVTFFEDGRIKRLDADDEPWKSARFLDGGRQVVVAARTSVLRWDPVSDERETLAAASAGETILAADLLGEEIVAWTQSPPPSKRAPF